MPRIGFFDQRQRCQRSCNSCTEILFSGQERKYTDNYPLRNSLFFTAKTAELHAKITKIGLCALRASFAHFAVKLFFELKSPFGLDPQGLININPIKKQDLYFADNQLNDFSDSGFSLEYITSTSFPFSSIRYF